MSTVNDKAIREQDMQVHAGKFVYLDEFPYTDHAVTARYDLDIDPELMKSMLSSAKLIGEAEDRRALKGLRKWLNKKRKLQKKAGRKLIKARRKQK